MPKFEGVQQKILLDKNCNQLVSAGAGSGKTTVMIEKLSNMIIEQGVLVENLLVVTFTVLAAGEMKTRLIEKLKSKLLDCGEQEKVKLLMMLKRQVLIQLMDLVQKL